MISVLVVDDSQFTREALRRALETDPGLKVVGEAKTGEEAVALARTLKPSLITMDLSMPGMGGLKAIEKIMAERPVAIVVISEKSSSPREDLNLEAMRAGALELVPKGDVFGGAELQLQQFATRMRQLAESANPQTPSSRPRASKPVPHEPPVLVGLGASAGGPRALAQVLGALPASFPAPIAIVQHMATDFFDSFVAFLASKSKLKLVRAENGSKAATGSVYVAPPNYNLTVERDLLMRLTPNTSTSAHCPSVDALFTTMARNLRGRCTGVLMTGMGADGAQGLLELRKSGARTIVQDAASCAVAGMPLAALDLEAAEEVLALGEIAGALGQVHGGAAPPRETRRKVLVVDDSPIVLAATKQLLERAGYEVRTQENPMMVAMGLRRDPVDLVLLDVNMPVVKGTQVVAALRASGLNATPVILYSDLDEKELASRASACGATGWIKKGNRDALLRAVDGWIGTGRA